MDRGGNDHYMGMTSCNGCGLTNSVGLFFDRSGDDTYGGRTDGYMNGGRADRNMSSIGIFVDVAGNDDYLSLVMKDDSVWSQTFYGGGMDVPPPPKPAEEAAAPPPPGPGPEPPNLKYPEIIATTAPLDQKVFDELWEISVRWEVGDNRWITPKARQRLIDEFMRQSVALFGIHDFFSSRRANPTRVPPSRARSATPGPAWGPCAPHTSGPCVSMNETMRCSSPLSRNVPSPRQTSITVMANDLPLGGAPMNGRSFVPRPVIRAQTLSPSAIISSMVRLKSENVSRR